MKCELIIFDLDGTLVDSIADIADAMNRVLEEFKYPTHSYESYKLFVGNGIKKLVIRSLPDYAQADDIVEKCLARMLDDYGQNYIKKSSLYDGIPALLDWIVERKIKFSILSNKEDTITQKVCEKLLAKWPFSMMMGATDRFPRKPDPTSALFIAESLGVNPDAVCYLGDSNVDMQTATKAGFTAVGVTWGFRSKQELVEGGAGYTIDKPMELPSLLGC